MNKKQEQEPRLWAWALLFAAIGVILGALAVGLTLYGFSLLLINGR